ncbi:MAG TPA: 2-oxoacid:acceptor oxidoreductase subunit alpha [Blastocatellia bacterium]|nr:2-oxoacid:acceptor oxidoreductase subunit alpha [Blastocatellia bacterium]
MREITIGIGGAAGDGLDKTGDTLAKTAARLGLYVSAYNSYQSVIRGGHIWLRVRLAEEKVYSQGDHLNVLIALNQDSIERHAPEVEPGGAIIYNSDKLHLDPSLIGDNILPAPMPVAALTKPFGKVQPVMQNTVALGALLYLIGLDFETAANVLADTFRHKGQAVIDQNVGIARAGYDYAREHFVPLGYQWTFTHVRRPFITGNEAFSFGAVVAGCRFYSAYPMTPASSILHWLAAHAEQCGIVVKQCEDELAVINMAIGAGYAGVRAMCGTSGGGFALMTEAVGQAGMIEAPVVIIEVQRGGPSTGVPTKTEQGDLNQVFGASQGDYPRVIIAPTDTTDCFYSVIEAFNLAEKYQLPVILISDLYLSEHPETIEPDALTHAVAIERGEIVTEWPAGNGRYKRYAFTRSGVSPRALPGTEGTLHTAATDDHDEYGILISDVYTSPPVRRKIHEKRMRKLEAVLRDLPPPTLEGPEEADVTLIGWGSTKGVIREAVRRLEADGIRANHLQIKYLFPFHAREVSEILRRSRKTICIEGNYSGQFARHLRAETGISVDDHIRKYDCEPFEPRYIVEQVKAILEGRPRTLELSREEAREVAYHYIRTQLTEDLRPGQIQRLDANGFDEPVWEIEIITRQSGERRGHLLIGAETGSTYLWQPVS